VIDLEGHELLIITVGSQTPPLDHRPIPSLEAVISGDVAYKRHPPVARADRPREANAVDRQCRADRGAPAQESSSPAHKRPDSRDDDPATILGDTKTYIRHFKPIAFRERIRPRNWSDKMMVLHGELGNPYTLWTAAHSVFEQGRGDPHEQAHDSHLGENVNSP